MPPLRILVPRTLAFLAVAGFIIGGPMWKQGLDRRSQVLFQWVMFSGYGTDVCDVRYVEVAADGARTPVDRYAVLGYDTKADAPGSIKKMKDLAAAKAVGKKLCRKLPEGTDLRTRVRCATKDGWRTMSKAEENLCTAR